MTGSARTVMTKVFVTGLKVQAEIGVYKHEIGRVQPLRVYEPLAEAGKQTPAQSLDARIYGKALTSWRGRDFAGAAESFASIADHDPAAALFMHRAKQLALSPPGPDWEPINTLEGK